MVIGRGLIANAFKKYEHNDSVIIFASGVSNSKETNPEEFLREVNLLSKYFNSKSRLIYFSTCSIDDPSLSRSPYISHKLNMEGLIKENFDNYIIFRLPNVVGHCKNSNTSFNFFKENIQKGIEIKIQKNATRYFIDSEDLSKLLPQFIDADTSRQTINVVFDNKIYISELVEIMESLIGKEAVKSYIEMGSDYDVDGGYFMKSLKHTIDENYNYNLVKKYIN